MSKLLFYLPISLSMILVYRSTWLPGGKIFQGKEDYAILFCFLILTILLFDFKKILSFQLRIFYNNRYFLFLIALLTLFSVTFYNTHELLKIKSVLRFLSYFAVFFIYFLYFPRFIYFNPGYLQKYIKFICNFGLASSILGILMLVGGIYPIPLYSSQLVSIITHPNNTSMIFTISVITTIYYYFWKKNEMTPVQKYYYIFSITIQFLAQLLTLTRAGIIGMFFGILIFLIIYYRKKAILIIPVLLTLSPVLLLGFITAKGFESFLSRFVLLIPAYHMIFENSKTLLWGYGFTNSLDVYQIYRISYNVLEANIEDPHNSIILLTMMVGLPITLLISLFILRYLYFGLKTGIINRFQDLRLFGGFASSYIISIIVHNLFDSELVRIEYFTMTFFIPFIGLLFIMADRNNLIDRNATNRLF